MPPPIPLSGAGSWYSGGSQSESASKVAKRGRTVSQASSGERAAAIVARTSATKSRTTDVSSSNSSTQSARFDAQLQDVEAALQLLVGRGERRQQPDHVAVEAARENQEAVLPRLRRHGLRH